MTGGKMWLLLPLVVASAAAASTAENEFYQNFVKDFVRFKHEMNPEAASSEGLHEYDSALTDFSPAGTERNRVGCMEFAGKARAILDGPEGLVGPMEKYYVKLVEEQCRTYLGGIELNGHLFGPVNFLEGVHTNYDTAFNRSSFFKLDSLKDYSIALQRLNKVPKAVEGVIEALELGIERNVTYPEESLSRVDKQFQYYLDKMEDPTKSGFYTPFRDMDKKGLNEMLVMAVQQRAQAAISNSIAPAMVKLRSFLKDTYMKHLRSGPGISNIPNGKEYYQAALDFHTTIKGMSPEEIHNIGLEEISELQKGVLEVAKELGKEDLSFKEFLVAMKDDPDQKFKSSNEVLDYATDILKTRINPKMSQVIPEEFLTEKLFALKVEAVPPGGGGIAYYVNGNRDGTQNGTYYVNIANLDNFRKFEMVPLTLHEGNPGHHFDLTVFRFANDDFPEFLHSEGAGIYANMPAATPIYTAFQEGWGLYSEYLGHEMGLYKDPSDLFGFYSFNLLRAGRLVVDTGIHAMGWSRQQAIDYLLDNTAMSMTNVESEIDRYITWPGQAVAYKIGERAIKKLRAKKEEEQGEDFDIRRFHKHLLSCRGPMDSLEECFDMMAQKDKKTEDKTN